MPVRTVTESRARKAYNIPVYRWFIAFKYLTSRFITFSALLIVALGVAFLIVVLSVMEGFRADLKERIRGTSADIRVESKTFIGLRDPAGVEEKVRGVEGARAVSPFVESLVMYRHESGSGSDYFSLLAVDLKKEVKVGGLSKYLLAAKERAHRADQNEIPRASLIPRARPWEALKEQPTSPEEILSPEWLEKKLWDLSGEPPPKPGLRPILVGYETTRSPLWFLLGRTLLLNSYSPVTNRTCTGEFYVAGVFLSRDYQFDRYTVVMPLSSAIDFLGLREPMSKKERISGLRVKISPGEELDAVRNRIDEELSEVPFIRVRTWREEKASLLRAVGIEKTVVGIILGVLILFAGFMIFIVLTVQVVEKTRDLGILQSLGSTSWGIAGIYFQVGAGVCFLGTVLGTIYGVALSLSINTILNWLYLLVGFELFPRNVYYIDRIPVRLAPMDLLFIIAPTLIASLLASVIPAWRAARKDPVVALRYE